MMKYTTGVASSIHALWMDHVARVAPLIAGAPVFKEFKTSLEEVEPALLEAAERTLGSRSAKAVEKLLEEAKNAVARGSRPWADLRKTARSVERRGRVVRPEHAAVAWALLEAGLRELGEGAGALSALREAAERLARGEEAVVPVKDVAEFEQRARDVAHRLRLLLEEIAKYAEELEGKAKEPAGGDAQKAETVRREAGALKKAFAVTELAKRLARADTDEFGELGKATFADKAVAFFESLARGTAWSRIVLNAAERGEAYRALILAPKSAYDEYGAGREGRRMWIEFLERLAYRLADRSVEEFEVRVEREAEGVAVKVLVGGKAAEVKIEKTKGGTVFRLRGEWPKELGREAIAPLENVERGKAEPYQMRALMATDGHYNAEEGRVHATTTSVLQAALYKRFGLKVRHTNYADLTEDDLKPVLTAWLPKGEGGRKWIRLVKSDLENGVRALLNKPERREELKKKALDLLDRIEISLEGVDKEAEEGRRKIEEVRRTIAERIEKFLTELRLGEGGAVCLQDVKGCEHVLTYKHGPYARVIAPLLHYIAEDAPRDEVLKFLVYTILFDGSVSQNEVLLTVGHFGAKKNRLPLDIYDKIALYIVLAAKYGVDVRRVHIGENEIMIFFDPGHAAKMFATTWADFSGLLKWAKEHAGQEDHAFKKLENIREYVERYAEKIKIERELYSPPGVDPWVEVRFKDEKGSEVAHISIRWYRGALYAVFGGSREKAERLVSILSALGADAEAKKHSDGWYVGLYTDSIVAIRRKEWLEAVRALINALQERGIIAEEQRERLLRDVAAGPNVVEIAGVEFSVLLGEREVESGRSRWLEIRYMPRSPAAFDGAVRALKEAGFEEGLHFTAKRPKEDERGYIRLKLPAGLWELVRLSRAGVDWAERAVDRLREIAKARGFYDVLDEYLKPAEEAETVDPKTVVVEDKERGLKIAIRDLRREWMSDRLRVVVEYEVNGRAEIFSLAWHVVTGGRVQASVYVSDVKAIVLFALTGDESIREKRGVVTLRAKHLFALVKFSGVGWDLLRWYAEVVG